MEFPEMVLIEQQLNAPRAVDVKFAVIRELARIGLPKRVFPGMRVAITAGSRGIANIVDILAAITAECKKIGAKPFIVPSMGSHGGATAEGQELVLKNLGITQEAIGCPIVASMDVIEIGRTVEGIPVVIDRNAAEADGIVVVNRVKPHEEFNGHMGSGLMKMMAIGLGKYTGALAYHKNALWLGLGRVITSVARVVMDKTPLLFGVAILENAYGETVRIVAVEPGELEKLEKRLFAEARQLAPGLPFDQIDVLIVDELGKEISGTGMDARIIGRTYVLGEPRLETPHITRIVVRDLTQQTHGNAAGIGFADYVTRRVVEKIDRRATYLNCMTSMTPEEARIPIAAESDRQAVEWALNTSGVMEPAEARVVRIKNTAFLRRMYVSSSLQEAARKRKLRVLGESQRMTFDKAGVLQGGFQT